jgi:hypothetical protein
MAGAVVEHCLVNPGSRIVCEDARPYAKLLMRTKSKSSGSALNSEFSTTGLRHPAEGSSSSGHGRCRHRLRGFTSPGGLSRSLPAVSNCLSLSRHRVQCAEPRRFFYPFLLNLAVERRLLPPFRLLDLVRLWTTPLFRCVATLCATERWPRFVMFLKADIPLALAL